jgi:ribosomal protein L7/L12
VLISEIKGISLDEALKLTERTIIPVLTGVSKDVADFHREKFERNKISARVTTRTTER